MIFVEPIKSIGLKPLDSVLIKSPFLMLKLMFLHCNTKHKHLNSNKKYCQFLCNMKCRTLNFPQCLVDLERSQFGKNLLLCC